MKYNRKFLEHVDLELLRDVSQDDIPESFRAVLDEGWAVDGTGAYLLRRFLGGYVGNRDAFIDLTSYEAAVNGRGVPDLDVGGGGKARILELVRRAYAFAWMALLSARNIPDHAKVTAYISFSRTLMDETLYTANVTFCAEHDGELPYVDIADLEKLSNAVLILESTECAESLPHRA